VRDEPEEYARYSGWRPRLANFRARQVNHITPRSGAQRLGARQRPSGNDESNTEQLRTRR
jgi:hypothetical protein